jgi:branched-chain amino acid transport system permease protein
MSRGWLFAGLAAVALVVLFSIPLWMPSFYLTLTIRILFFSIAAMSLTFLAGQIGLVSLAQATFFGTAAYILAIATVQHQLPFYVSAPLALAAATGLAAVFGLLAMRTSGIYFLMITLALGQIVWGLAFQWISLTGGYDGVSGVRPPTVVGLSFAQPQNFYYALLVAFCLVTVLLLAIIRSPFGLVMRGVRESPSRMQALGYPVTLIKYLAFVMAGSVAGLAGIFFAYYTGIVNPSSLDLFRSVWFLVVAILGGVGSIFGAILGTAVVVFLEIIVSQFTERYMTVIGLVFLLTILFAPDGLIGRLQSLGRYFGKEPATKSTVIDEVAKPEGG